MVENDYAIAFINIRIVVLRKPAIMDSKTTVPAESLGVTFVMRFSVT